MNKVPPFGFGESVLSYMSKKLPNANKNSDLEYVECCCDRSLKTVKENVVVRISDYNFPRIRKEIKLPDQ